MGKSDDKSLLRIDAVLDNPQNGVNPQRNSTLLHQLLSNL